MTPPIVLVTGGAGFIGSYVAARFAREGWAVRILDDLSSGSRANLDAGWELHHTSLGDRTAVAKAVSGCTVAVHLAAFTSVSESFEQRDLCYRSNVQGTFHLLEACAAREVPRVVFASSSAVYAELPDAPKSEAEAADPISPYAISKLEGERMLAAFAEHRSLSSAALRFFNVYGPRQPADSAYAAVVPRFFDACLRGEALTIYGDGKQTRDFVSVHDVADAVHHAAMQAQQGVYNIGSGQPTSILELAESIQKLTGSEPRLCLETPRPGDLLSSTADVAKTRRELGWQAQVPLAEGLADTWRWHCERTPHGPTGARWTDR